MVSCVAECDLKSDNQRFGGRAASIFKVEVRDQGDVSTALLSTQVPDAQI
jgi:hypothetical protein